jgi:16S rRNA (cytosine967-C5)-methyltransferase
VHALSLPEWIAQRFLDALGPSEAAALARAANETPPLTARANPCRATPEALLAELAPRWPEAKRAAHAPLALSLGHGVDPGSDPAFREGRFTIQDEASQLVVTLLDPQPGERVLDLCAAPGAKTTAIAEAVGETGLVVACDRNARRLALVGRAARRLGLANVHLAEADGTQPLAALPGAPFARVLVDAPCSGLGTLRRNPDARWRLRPDDPASLAATQSALLAQAAREVMPGGALVYSTCTLLAEENEAVVAAFLRQHPEFSPTPRAELPAAARPFVETDGFMRTWPQRHGMDGFFAARLRRAAR